MLEKEVNPDLLYSRIVHYYMDKKGYAKEKANDIAQAVIRRETERRTCGSGDCGHLLFDHIRNSGTCMVLGCDCRRFTRPR